VGNEFIFAADFIRLFVDAVANGGRLIAFGKPYRGGSASRYGKPLLIFGSLPQIFESYPFGTAD
jgi:hypothetical protein